MFGPLYPLIFCSHSFHSSFSAVTLTSSQYFEREGEEGQSIRRHLTVSDQCMLYMAGTWLVTQPVWRSRTAASEPELLGGHGVNQPNTHIKLIHYH